MPPGFTGSLAARLDKASALNVREAKAGGAHMFSLGSSSSLDIGRRNEEAAREALTHAGLAVRAAATGGSKGRTVRVYVDSGLVTVKEPGVAHVELFSGTGAVRALR